MKFPTSFWKSAYFAENRSSQDLLLEIRMLNHPDKWLPVKSGTTSLVHATAVRNKGGPGEIFERIIIHSDLVSATTPQPLWEPHTTAWKGASLDESRYARRAFTLVITDADVRSASSPWE